MSENIFVYQVIVVPSSRTQKFTKKKHGQGNQEVKFLTVEVGTAQRQRNGAPAPLQLEK